MKNKFSLAALAAIGLVVVSCSTDTKELNPSSQKQQDGLPLKTGDSIHKSLPTPYAGEEGVIPPKKP